MSDTIFWSPVHGFLRLAEWMDGQRFRHVGTNIMYYSLPKDAVTLTMSR